MNNTVMIVDDKKINIDILTHILRNEYAVMAALNGTTALREINHKKPDLILLDMYMPGMDGIDVLKVIKSKPELAGISVIIITGEQDEYVEEKALELGAADCIRKPYNASIIIHKVRNHMNFKTDRDRAELLSHSHEALIMAMSLLSKSHNNITGEDINRLKLIIKILCENMLAAHPGIMHPRFIDPIVLYSPLHDVGKSSISQGILKKEGALTDVEFDIVKTHTTHGANFLRTMPQFEHSTVAVDIAEGHHEKYDGSGYPHGLKGEEIPLSARLVAIADVYDTLRSHRPHKAPFSREEAMRTILQGDGRTLPAHFDPRILDVFKQTEDKINKLYA